MIGSPQPLVAALAAGCADPTVALAFGDGIRPSNTGTRPWVVVWPDSGQHSPASLSRLTDDYTVTVVAHCTGLTPESARIAMVKFAQVCDGLRYADLGSRRVVGVEQLSAQPLTRDDDTDPPLYMHTAEWRFRTTPA